MVFARIAIVILNWRGWRDTIACLASVQALSHESFCVIVVDNDSQDESVPEIEAWLRTASHLTWRGTFSADGAEGTRPPLEHRDAIVIRAPSNGGFASGNNYGLRYALNWPSTACWLLNNDTEVHPDALSALEARLASESSVGMVGSVLCFFDDPDRIQAVGGVEYQFWRAMGHQLGEGLLISDPRIAELAAMRPTYIAGASMLVSRAFLDDVGLMDEANFLYFEEIDWISRAKGRWTTATALASLVRHKEGGSIGTSSRRLRSLLSQYYMTRGLLRFYGRHRPLLIPVAVARVGRELVRFLLQGEKAHARVTWEAMLAAYRGRFGQRKGAFN